MMGRATIVKIHKSSRHHDDDDYDDDDRVACYFDVAINWLKDG